MRGTGANMEMTIHKSRINELNKTKPVTSNVNIPLEKRISLSCRVFSYSLVSPAGKRDARQGERGREYRHLLS